MKSTEVGIFEAKTHAFLWLVFRRPSALAAGSRRHCRDPFDRLLVGQAKALGLAHVTGDPAFADYGVEVIW